ncbi:MAG: pitrilysin family protein [Catalinimonas sp.]
MSTALDRTQAPPFQPVGAISIARATSDALPNGTPRHVIRAGAQPVVGLELIFPAGTWFESTRGAAFFLSKLLLEGTRRRSGAEIQEAFSRWGTFPRVTATPDHLTVAVYTVKRFLPEVLPLLVEVLQEATLPAEEFENQRRIQQQTLQVNLQKTSFVAGRTFRGLLFGDEHPYGAGVTEAHLAKLNRDAVAGLYEQNVRTMPAELILAGDVTDDVLALVDRTLGRVARADAPLTAPVHTTHVRVTREATAVFPTGQQSSIRVGRVLFTPHHQDVHRFQVLNEICGGYFGSRLMRNIREEKGYTYGISSGYAALRHAGYWIIGTDVKREATEATFAEVHHELGRLREELVSEKELDTVRNYMLGTLAGSITTPFELADKFKGVHFRGLDYDYYEQRVRTIREVTPEALRETARRYFDPSELVEVTAGERV